MLRNKTLKIAAIVISGSFAIIPIAIADTLPTSIDECKNTYVKDVLYRLSAPDENGVYIPIRNSGSAISYTNGAYQVSYKFVPALHKSQRGDEVRLCLTSIPDCSRAKPNDKRGKRYLATNLRTGASWELPDSQHMCGGA